MTELHLSAPPRWQSCARKQLHLIYGNDQPRPNSRVHPGHLYIAHQFSLDPSTNLYSATSPWTLQLPSKPSPIPPASSRRTFRSPPALREPLPRLWWPPCCLPPFWPSPPSPALARCARSACRSRRPYMDAHASTCSGWTPCAPWNGLLRR